jgi:hypothetical protein
MEAVTLYDRPQSTMSATSMFLIHRLDRLDYKLELWKTALDAVDGSRNRHRDVPPCGCCRRVVRVRLWLGTAENDCRKLWQIMSAPSG